MFSIRALFLPLLLGALTVTTFAQQAHVQWMSLEEAAEAQKTEPRQVMMDVYTQWCGPCKMMMANTFTNKDVIAYLNKNYYPVKFDAESSDPVTFKGKTYENPGYRQGVRGRNSPHQLSRTLGVTAFPTMVYFDENMDIIAPISGYKTPPQLELYIRYFAEHYITGVKVKQEEWESYRDSFTPTFR